MSSFMFSDAFRPVFVPDHVIQDEPKNHVIKRVNQYALLEKIGYGGSSKVFLAIDTEKGIPYAAKAVFIDGRSNDGRSLQREIRIHRQLHHDNIVKLHEVLHLKKKSTAYLILEYASFGSLGRFVSRGLDMKTIATIFKQICAGLRYLHSKGISHRDVKPANFVFGRKSGSGVLHLIDFGLATQYRDPRTGDHIPYSENQCVAGTARYASINAHLGIVASRRDDLESLAYMLVYLLKARLPWQGLHSGDKYAAIAKVKMQTSVDELCAGTPREFAVFVDQVRSLRFDDTPDYAFYRKLFRQLFLRQGFQFDGVYDWGH